MAAWSNTEENWTLSFIVKLSNGRGRCWHQDQLQKRTAEVMVEEPIELEIPVVPVTVMQISPPVSDVAEAPSTSDTPEQTAGSSVPNLLTRKVYPKRHCTAVQRYEPTV